MTLPVLILVGGLGTRLKGALGNLPKALAPMGGRPFLSHLLDKLESAGARDILLCTGFRGDKIRSEFGDAYGSLTIRYSQEPRPMGTAGAMRRALPQIESSSVLILNGDSWIDADLNMFVNWHYENSYSASMMLTSVSDVSRFGSVEVQNDGSIVAFHEKQAKAGPGWVNAGVYALDRGRIEEIPAEVPCSLEHDVFPLWTTGTLRGLRTSGMFVDIGTLESLKVAEDLLAKPALVS